MRCFNEYCKCYEDGRDKSNCILLFDFEVSSCPNHVKTKIVKVLDRYNTKTNERGELVKDNEGDYVKYEDILKYIGDKK